MLDYNETREALVRLPLKEKLTTQEIQTVLAVLDADAGGSITVDEFKNFVEGKNMADQQAKFLSACKSSSTHK